nr:ComEC/Rec2 family competence protein [Rhizobium sp. L1K21]
MQAYVQERPEGTLAVREAQAFLNPVEEIDRTAVPLEKKPAIRLGLYVSLPKLRNLESILVEEQAFGRLFLFFPLFLAFGAAFWFARDYPPSRYLTFSTALVFSLAAFALCERRLLHVLATLAAAFSLGAVLADMETARKDTIMLDSPVTAQVTGRIIDLEPARGGRLRYTLEILSIRDPVLRRPPRQVRLTGLSPKEKVLPGDIISGPARLSPPSGPVLPGGYNFAFGPYFEGIGAVGFFYGYPVGLKDAEQSSEARLGASILQAQAKLSLAITERLRSVLSGDVLAFATAIIVNDRRAMSDSALDALRLSGLAHIIAISGLHMALAAGMFFWLLRSGLALFPGFSQRFPVKKIAAAAAIVAASIYLFISGAPISAVRAYIMLTVMLLAVVAGRQALNLRNLAIAALFIIVVTPSSVMTPGFQMSFAATAALIAGYGAWRRKEEPKEISAGRGALSGFASGGLKLFGGLALTSVIGGGATALVAASTFNTLPAYGVLANVLAMPVFSFVAMPAALLSLAAAPFGLEWPFLHALGFGLELTLTIANWVSELGGGLTIGYVSKWLLVLGCAALFSACLFRSRAAAISCLAVYLGAAALGIFGIGGSGAPDLIVYEDGTLAAVVGDSSLALSNTKASGFVTDQWSRALGLETLEKPSDIAELAGWSTHTDSLPEDLPNGSFHCLAEKWCVVRLSGGITVIQIEDIKQVGFACDHADLVISPWRHSFRQCRSGAYLLDRNVLRRNGSIAIRIDNREQNHADGPQRAKILFETALGQQAREWNSHRLYDWRSGRFDPPAKYVLSDNGE